MLYNGANCTLRHMFCSRGVSIVPYWALFFLLGTREEQESHPQFNYFLEGKLHSILLYFTLEKGRKNQRFVMYGSLGIHLLVRASFYIEVPAHIQRDTNASHPQIVSRFRHVKMVESLDMWFHDGFSLVDIRLELIERSHVFRVPEV